MNSDYNIALKKHFDWCRESIRQGRQSLELFESGGTASTNGVDTTEETKTLFMRVIADLEKHLRDHDEPLPE